MSEMTLQEALDGLLDGEPPIGDLVDAAMSQGRRVRRRNAMIGGLGVAAAVVAIALAVSVVSPPSGGGSTAGREGSGGASADGSATATASPAPVPSGVPTDGAVMATETVGPASSGDAIGSDTTASIVLSVGKPCGHAASACPGGSCVSSACALIHIRTENFTGTYTCSFSTTFGGGGLFATATITGDVDEDTRAWFGAPNYPVQVSCIGPAGQSVGSGIQWPSP